MAANTRTFSPPCSLNQVISATNFNKLDTNGAGAVARASTATGTRRIPLKPVETVAVTGGGTRMCNPGSGVLGCYNVADDLWIPVDELPHKHVLANVIAVIQPAGGHPADPAQPAVLPSIHAYKVDSAGTITLLGSATYTWVDKATYEAGFNLIPAASFAHTIDRSQYTYWVKIILESGANSVSGLTIKSLNATVTIDSSYGGPDFSFWV